MHVFKDMTFFKQKGFFDFSLTEVYFLGFSWTIKRGDRKHTKRDPAPAHAPVEIAKAPSQRHHRKGAIAKAPSQRPHRKGTIAKAPSQRHHPKIQKSTRSSTNPSSNPSIHVKGDLSPPLINHKNRAESSWNLVLARNCTRTNENGRDPDHSIGNCARNRLQ